MIHDLSVRSSREADVAAVAAIYADAVRTGTASFELEPPGEAEMARRRSALLADGFPFLVAERAGRVLGFAYAGPYRARPAYRFAVEDSIYVAPDAKGSGVGRTLLARLVDECTALGFRQMIAVIGDQASTGSIGLHRTLGFGPAGVLKAVGWKHGRWIDSVLMQLALGPADGAPPDRP